MYCFLDWSSFATICEPSEVTLDILNFFVQFLTVGFSTLFGLLVMLIVIQIYKS